jgi:hypothetical protein
MQTRNLFILLKAVSAADPPVAILPLLAEKSAPDQKKYYEGDQSEENGEFGKFERYQSKHDRGCQ